MSKDAADTDERLADVADAVIALAHHLEIRGATAREITSLTGVEITVMREVHRCSGITATGIAERTGLQRSNVSSISHGLERAGLLRRRNPSVSARGVGFSATPLAEGHLRVLRNYWVERLGTAPRAALHELAQNGHALATLVGDEKN